MDSGNEGIVLDDSVVTTNGINGNHDDFSEMKTRSKIGDEESAKPKLRSTRTTTNIQKNMEEKVDKANSDSEKKDKKMNLRSGDTDSEVKVSGKEASAVRNIQQDGKVGAAGSGVIVKKGKTIEEEKVTGTPAKKKASEREDDSGINSRASSVSNEDTVAPRMRTRSSKTSDIPSTSTPSYKKGQGRMPLSTYEFDDITFDDDLSSNSLKRKAVLYIEEMDDDEENKEENGEPIPKRSTFGERGGRFVGTLLNPLRMIRGKFTFGSRIPNVETPSVDDEVSHPTEVKENGDNAEIENATSPETDNIVQVDEAKSSSTCCVM